MGLKNKLCRRCILWKRYDSHFACRQSTFEQLGVESRTPVLRKKSEERTAKSWVASGKPTTFTIACPDRCIARKGRERVRGHGVYDILAPGTALFWVQHKAATVHDDELK
ncbi:hypothetical protein N7G274_010103 [Stereocaulon virgatum]|uniref:Ribosomal protein S14 n=1 Tax=Stereocaulon virgatum TaxID=373712 RepID=A0ABR3ZU61_9LECA